jgi:glutathione peroxidase
MGNSVSDISVKTIDGQEKKLAEYIGNVLLIVNVASYCGYTSQYKGLEALNHKYRDAGLRILGFPCNDFGAQEPGTNEEIAQFCETRYGVSFEMFDKVKALGANKHPLYERLTSSANPPGDVAWNFEKFLIGKNGEIVNRFKSGISPESLDLVKAIEQELGIN